MTVSDLTITWDILRRFFEVDNFGLPLPDHFAQEFDAFKSEALGEAWEDGYHASSDDSATGAAAATPNPHRGGARE